jgi:putative transposase
LVSWLKTCYKVSVRRACRLVRFRRATFCYQSKRPEQAYLRKRIKEIAAEKPRYGYRRITILIRREGLLVNVKRVYRIYKEEALQMRKKVPKRRVSPQLRQVRVPAAKQNQCWSMDFVSDNLYNGQKLRCLTIVDNHTRISPTIGVGFRYTACNVIETLNLAVKQ